MVISIRCQFSTAKFERVKNKLKKVNTFVRAAGSGQPGRLNPAIAALKLDADKKWK